LCKEPTSRNLQQRQYYNSPTLCLVTLIPAIGETHKILHPRLLSSDEHHSCTTNPPTGIYDNGTTPLDITSPPTLRLLTLIPAIGETHKIIHTPPDEHHSCTKNPPHRIYDNGTGLLDITIPPTLVTVIPAIGKTHKILHPQLQSPDEHHSCARNPPPKIYDNATILQSHPLCVS
jgi:hypothetical protein